MLSKLTVVTIWRNRKVAAQARARVCVCGCVSKQGASETS